MYKCEACQIPHDRTYGSGRFCSVRCARSHSTEVKRAIINQKVSEALIGREGVTKGMVLNRSDESRKSFQQKHAALAEARWKTAEWDNVPKAKWYDRILMEQGNSCAICKNPPEWLGKPLRLHLDHISGDRSNNSRLNLRLLCPNCHFQTPTWGARNMSEASREKLRVRMKR